jgi:hypothetical protein
MADNVPQMALDPTGWMLSVKNVPLPGTMLFSKVWGSHSHNTALPDSDVDYLVVYVAAPQDLLGLHPPAETVTHEKPDCQFHEVGKFASLLLKGNPGIVECLFTERLCYETGAWQLLKQMRGEFLNARTVGAYLGYCMGQTKKLWNRGYLHTSGGSYNAKWAYHLIRLAKDAYRICQGQEPVVWKEGEELELLMDIRHGRKTQGEVERMATALINDIEAARPWPIPEKCNEERLNHWLLYVRGYKSHQEFNASTGACRLGR